MSTMVERVARELCTADGHDPDSPTSDVYVPGDPVAHLPWAGYRKMARAAIEAMIPIIEEIPLTSLFSTSEKDLAMIWSFAADSQRGSIVDNLRAGLEENA